MNDNSLLHRQVNPAWVQEDQISSQVFEIGQVANSTGITSLTFTPMPKDNNQLSVYNGDKFTAEESFAHFTQTLNSAGVVSVTVSESKALSLPCVEDNQPFDGHTYIDFSDLSKKQIKGKAQSLKNSANQRGWSFKKTS